MSALKRFLFLLYENDGNEPHEMDTFLDAQGFATMKKAFSWQKTCVSYYKTSKNGFCSVFQVCTKTLRNLTVWPRWCPNSSNSRAFNCTRCCDSKKGNYGAEKFVLVPRNIKKGFFGVLSSAVERFGILLHAIADIQTHKTTTQVERKGVEMLK